MTKDSAELSSKSLLSRVKSKTSWAHSVLDETGNLLLVTAHFAEGRDAFYYMLLSKPRRAELLQALEETDQLDLAKYGQIIRSGWGSPSEDDKAYIREQYKAET